MDVVTGATNAGAGRRQRCSFLVLWLRFTATFFLLGCTLAYLSRGEEGLSMAIGGGIVATPITGLIWAGAVRLFQRIFSPRQAPTTPTTQAEISPTQPSPEPAPTNSCQDGDLTDDDGLYAMVGAELRTGQMQDAAWARALAESDGDVPKTRARYAKIRVEEMRVARQEAAVTAASLGSLSSREPDTDLQEASQESAEPQAVSPHSDSFIGTMIVVVIICGLFAVIFGVLLR